MGLVARYLNVDPAKLQAKGVQSVKSRVANLCEYRSLTIDPVSYTHLPQNRKMMQVSIEDATEAERMVTILMGDKVEPRRAYIQQYANFNKQDAFIQHVDLGGNANG